MARQQSVLSLARRIALLVLFMCDFSVQITNGSLYNDSVNIEEVTSSDFYDVLTGKDHIWVINYYKSWCGHCQRYAPIFAAFAKDIIGWSRAVRVAVIDCAVSSNLDVCRANDVKLVPTVKFLRACATAEDKGQLWETIKTVDSLRHQTIDFLEGGNASRCSAQVPWPSLQATNASSYADLRGKAERIILVLENDDSYIGRELILDYSNSSTTKSFRVLPSNRALSSELQALGTAGEYATLYVINEGSQIPKILARASTAEGAREIFQAALYHEQTTTESPDIQTTTLRILADPTKVYQVDLDNALYLTLAQEVPVHTTLNETELHALRDFIDALVDYYPGRPSVRLSLRRLQSYVWEAQPGTRGQDLSDFIRRLSIKGEGLPPLREYVGCLGSQPQYRGFPCSLWMLFHTLTVRSYAGYREGRSKQPLNVLRSIKGFVVNYFSCRECAKNFAKESENMEEEIKNPEDAVLYLWSLHNRVNARLAGDKTEDPQRPKVAFPPVFMCPQCRKRDRWDQGSVLVFLQCFYGPGNLVQPST
ncbi:sulfhydryl oxidase 1-like [Ornithodoros turicata]|uniref:sulfhydryl oxidase 1-like n=1 Tax=Ornithodoros turicata TaxID=34597 RepID=UPI003139FF87